MFTHKSKLHELQIATKMPSMEPSSVKFENDHVNGGLQIVQSYLQLTLHDTKRNKPKKRKKPPFCPFPRWSRKPPHCIFNRHPSARERRGWMSSLDQEQPRHNSFAHSAAGFDVLVSGARSAAPCRKGKLAHPMWPSGHRPARNKLCAAAPHFTAHVKISSPLGCAPGARGSRGSDIVSLGTETKSIAPLSTDTLCVSKTISTITSFPLLFSFL